MLKELAVLLEKNVFFWLKSASGYKKPGLMPGMLHKIHTDTETRHIQTHTDTHMDFDIYIYIYKYTHTYFWTDGQTCNLTWH